MPEHADRAEVPSIHLGARGWDFPAWCDGYYPQDLPADWRLAYYANDFSVVLVPQPCWVGAEPEQGRVWRDEVSDAFRFYLELTEPQPFALARLPDWADSLGAGLGGILVSGTPGPSLEACFGGRLFQVLEMTHPTVSPRPLAGPGRVAVVARAETLGSLREQRDLFSELVTRFGSQGPIPFFMAGNPPPSKVLLDARELAQLMGLA